jgi:hypothetical protein
MAFRRLTEAASRHGPTTLVGLTWLADPLGAPLPQGRAPPGRPIFAFWSAYAGSGARSPGAKALTFRGLPEGGVGLRCSIPPSRSA